MKLTKNAPWKRKLLGVNEVSLILRDDFNAKKCWNVKKYLGSMLYWDFGAEILIPGRRTASIKEGESMLSVRDCYWELYKDTEYMLDSEAINHENISLLKIFNGCCLCDMKMSNSNMINFIFSENIIMSLDCRNRYETDADIAELTTSDGRIISIDPDGLFFLSDEVSIYRFVDE